MGRNLFGLIALGILASMAVAQEKPANTRGSEDHAEDGAGKLGKHRYHALLIGVSKYADDSLTLKGPANDVESIRKLLIDTCGFHNVKVLTDKDATKAKILAHIRAYQGHTVDGVPAKKLKSNDHLLIWYAGHGEAGDVNKTEGYWLPHDALPHDSSPGRENKKSWIRFDTVLMAIDRITTGGNILLVSDSCFAGGLADGAQTGRQNFFVMTSGQLEKVEDVYQGGRSQFALKFIDALGALSLQAESGNRSTMTTAHIYKEHIRKLTRPLYVPRRGSHDDNDHFTFLYGPHFLDPAEVAAGMSKQLRREFTKRRTGNIWVYRPKDDDVADDCAMVLVPATTVRGQSVRPFLMDRHEVTVGMFRKFLNENGQLPGMRYWNERGYNKKNQPVVGITFEHARTYARWAGKNVPTEIEWEAAAAGLEPIRKWDWQPFLPPILTDKADHSRLGIFDLRGGAREWCQSMRPDQGTADGLAILKGWSVVAAHRRERSDFHWNLQWAEVTDLRVPRNNVGFRCIRRLSRR